MEENKEILENTNQEIQESEPTATEQLIEENIEASNKIVNAVNDVKNAVKENASKLLRKLDDSNLNEETMKKYLNEFTESINGLVNKAAVKVNEMKEDPKTSEFMNKAQQSYEDFATKTKEVVSSASNKLNEVDIKESLVNATEKVKTVATDLSDKYQAFVHNPKVQKAVVKTIDTTKSITSKAFNTLKKLVKKEEKEREE